MVFLAAQTVYIWALRWSRSHGQFDRSIIYITNVKLPVKSEPLNERGKPNVLFGLKYADIHMLSGG